MNHQKLKKSGRRLHLILAIENTLKSFLLSTSLVFILGACSNSESSSKKSSTCFEFNKDKTQIIGYLETAANGQACPKDVTIPDEIISIADNTFENKALTSVHLPKGLVSIGKSAFKGNSLTSITIPESVTNIEGQAFVGNPFSSYVYVPNKNTQVDTTAFDSDIIVVIEGTDSCFGRDINDDTALTDYFCLATTVEISDGVTEIRSEVFKDKGFTSVVIPESVTNIGDRAFAGNPDLEVYVFPSGSNPTVGDNAFPNGYAIATTDMCFEFDDTIVAAYYDNEENNVDNESCPRDVVIPQGVTSIGASAFSYSSLTSVIISQGVTSIEYDAFYVNSLISVTLPNSLTTIGDYAFSENSLTSVIIPQGMTSIGENAFSYNSLTSVIIPEGMTYIEYDAFYANSLTSVTLPNSLTTIRDYAFSENSLTSVIIPQEVTSIGNYAFSENSLASVIIGSGITVIGSNAFGGNVNLSSICIEAQLSAITLGTNSFPILPTYESDGDCFN